MPNPATSGRVDTSVAERNSVVATAPLNVLTTIKDEWLQGANPEQSGSGRLRSLR
jgi:hypothetical protein